MSSAAVVQCGFPGFQEEGTNATPFVSSRGKWNTFFLSRRLGPEKGRDPPGGPGDKKTSERAALSLATLGLGGSDSTHTQFGVGLTPTYSMDS